MGRFKYFSLVSTLVLALLASIAFIVLSYSQNETAFSNTKKPQENDTLTIEMTSDVHLQNNSFDMDKIIPRMAPPVTDEITDWQESVYVSQSFEDLILAAILTSDDIHLKEKYLLEAYRYNEKNVLVNEQILNFCFNNGSSTLCSLPFVEPLSELANSDAFVAAEIATAYYARGDFQTALGYLQLASDGTKSNSNFIEYMKISDGSAISHGIERSVLSALQHQSAARSALSAPLHNITQVCVGKGRVESPAWKTACLNALKNIANISYDMQTRMHTKIMVLKLESDLHGTAGEDIQPFLEELNQEMLPQMVLIEKLPVENPTITNETWQNYLDQISLTNDLAAFTSLLEGI